MQRAAVVVGVRAEDAAVEAGGHGEARAVDERGARLAAAGDVVAHAVAELAAVADDRRVDRRARLGRVPDLRAHVEALDPLVVVHDHRGQPPLRCPALGGAVVDAVAVAEDRREQLAEAPVGVLLAAAGDEAEVREAARGRVVDPAPGEVQEVMDHHLGHGQRLGVGVLGVDEHLLGDAGHEAGLGGGLLVVGPQVDLVDLVHVGQRGELRRVQREEPLRGTGRRCGQQERRRRDEQDDGGTGAGHGGRPLLSGRTPATLPRVTFRW